MYSTEDGKNTNAAVDEVSMLKGEIREQNVVTRTSEAWQKGWKDRKSLEVPGSPACQGWNRLEKSGGKASACFATLEQPGLSGNFPD